MSDQLSLFSVRERSVGRYLSQQPRQLEISTDALRDWKQRVFQYQQQVMICPAPQQGSLFTTVATAAEIAASIDPFKLPQQNTEFWRWKVDDPGTAALYFVIDYELPLLLYVGETVKSGQRWKGEHDCKRYLLNYRQAHVQHQLGTMLGIAFWLHAPEKTRPRQHVESALIHQWRSPFNKENWEFWSTPFIGEK